MGSMAWRFSGRELEYVKEVLDSGFGSSTSGTMNQRLERAFAERFGVRYAVTFNSGTSTLHAALAAFGVGPGDEVIVPALTVISCASAVLFCNAVPVFADIDPETFELDPEDVARKITPRTKAVMPVALYGLAPDMEPIMLLAREHGLRVLEDCAQCVLGEYKGRLVGTIGDVASFSFENSKHLSTGDGGLILTDDEALATAIRKFSSLGFVNIGAGEGRVRLTKDMFQDPDFKRHDRFGWQYRLPEVCAAVGLAQLERVDYFVEMRRTMAQRYLDVIGDHPLLRPQRVPGGCVHSYYTFAARFEGGQRGIAWKEFREKYKEHGGDGIYAAWSLLYNEPVIKEARFYGKGCPTACPHYAGAFNVEAGQCPNAESVQPKLMQFTTNQAGEAECAQQAEAMRKTLDYFGT
ncbi:MAG: DegT/DnrJ/EryC1/StrS family aminotransferase [Candidatus Hydrogenedentes bacterium]|nr:DegT/DnrJ/EryC1/StrS family aminotransferase [Candidatus Hydrogenedentota bacterium]